MVVRFKSVSRGYVSSGLAPPGAAYDGAGTMLIDHIDDPDRETRRAVLGAIDAFNKTRTSRADDYRQMAIFHRDAAGEVDGGLWAVIDYDWMHIDLLALPAEARGKGVGRAMMRTAEWEAGRQGCVGIWLDTGSFQAPGFYAKLGYEVLGQIDDYNPGITRFWLRKLIDRHALARAAELQADHAPDAVGRERILDVLRAYNDEIAGPANRRIFCLALREQAGGPVVGGLWGVISSNWLFVELLVLPEPARGHGLGTRLMRAAEAFARLHGCRGVFLDTFSFQARPFYERLGYAVYGEIPDHPRGHSRFLMARRLDSPALDASLQVAEVARNRPESTQ